MGQNFICGRWHIDAAFGFDVPKAQVQPKSERGGKNQTAGTGEKQQELIEIEQKKEQELLALEEDKMKIELRHLNNLLAASTMNLVVKTNLLKPLKRKYRKSTAKGKNKETNKLWNRS
ncbi:MAG: hypothetical protein R2788_09395 [Saprospiraceae bacterium]